MRETGVLQLTADLIERLRRPGDDRERVQAQFGVLTTIGADGRDPLGRVGADQGDPGAALLAEVREGTVVVHSMDRLARNLDDLRRLVKDLTGREVRIQFVKEQLTFTGEDSPLATLLLSVMGAFAEFELALIGVPVRGSTPGAK